jgi:hypothetical protein
VEECTRWDNLSRWISFRNPVSRWIGLRCSEFSLWSVRGKNGSRPLDLGPFTRQPSDRIGGARGLTLLTPGRRPDLHRDIDIREIGVPEVEGIGTSQVSKSRRDQNRPS